MKLGRIDWSRVEAYLREREAIHIEQHRRQKIKEKGKPKLRQNNKKRRI